MICKNCGGQIPQGSNVCSFCETPVCGGERETKGGATDLEKRMAEILMGTGCGGCSGDAAAEQPEKTQGVKEAHWWKEGDCASCGGGITGPDKDLKYVLTIVGLIAGVVIFALAVRHLFGFGG